MFDTDSFFLPFADLDPNLIDFSALSSRLEGLSDAELSALEDDLDFCSFTGVPSTRVLNVLKDVIDLDEGWAQLASRGVTPQVPLAY